MAPDNSSHNANIQKQPAAAAGGAGGAGAGGVVAGSADAAAAAATAVAAAAVRNFSANGEGGIPFYEAQRKNLLKLMEKRRKIADRLAQREEAIERKETEYLESTPAGNILTGFDNYTKATSQVTAAQRRKAGSLDQHRVFSRSSLSYNSNNNNVAGSSGEESGSATPVSASFAPTPTSAAGSKARSKKKALVTDTGGDSDSEAREVKKVRANFGASSSSSRK